MRPAPTMPSVPRQRRLPSSIVGSQPWKRAGTHQRSPSAMRRAAAKVRATASSAVVSVSTPGVLPTGRPRRVAAAHVDVVVADGVLAVDGAAGGREGAEQLRRPALRELADGGIARLADGRPISAAARMSSPLRDLDAALGGGEELQPALARQLLGDHHAARAAGVHDLPVACRVTRLPLNVEGQSDVAITLSAGERGALACSRGPSGRVPVA